MAWRQSVRHCVCQWFCSPCLPDTVQCGQRFHQHSSGVPRSDVGPTTFVNCKIGVSEKWIWTPAQVCPMFLVFWNMAQYYIAFNKLNHFLSMIEFCLLGKETEPAVYVLTLLSNDCVIMSSQLSEYSRASASLFDWTVKIENFTRPWTNIFSSDWTFRDCDQAFYLFLLKLRELLFNC